MGNINESKKRSVSLNTNPNHKASCPVRMAIRKNIKSNAGKDGEEREGVQISLVILENSAVVPPQTKNRSDLWVDN